MPSSIDPQQYTHAIIQNVQSGCYPDDEEVASSSIPPQSLEVIVAGIQAARDQIQSEICGVSKALAPDIDGWIAQAQTLRIDVQESQITAQTLTSRASDGHQLQAHASDLSGKAQLLESEVAFIQHLSDTLARLETLRVQLDDLEAAIHRDDVAQGITILSETSRAIDQLPLPASSRATAVFASRNADLSKKIKVKLQSSWNNCINVDKIRSILTINKSGSPESTDTLDLNTTVQYLNQMELLEQASQACSQDIWKTLIMPRLKIMPGGFVSSFKSNGNSVKIVSNSDDLSAEALFADLRMVLDFLRHNLPSALMCHCARYLIPDLVAHLINTWLAAAIPEDLDGWTDFRQTLVLVQNFGTDLRSHEWPGDEELKAWTDSIPQAWVKKCKEKALNSVRIILHRGINRTEIVERIETQILSHDDELLQGRTDSDDWNANWSDEEEASTSILPSSDAPRSERHVEGVGRLDDEDDTSAWDDGPEETLDDSKRALPVEDVEEHDAHAWGWGDEDETGDGPLNSQGHARKPSAVSHRVNGRRGSKKLAGREVTLRESYRVTSVPKELLRIVTQVLNDSRMLAHPETNESPITKTADDLIPIIGLTVAFFRAGSLDAYGTHSCGNMLIYNDSMWLSEQLNSLSIGEGRQQGEDHSRTSQDLFDAQPQITALLAHSKRAYAREMEAQRTILNDILDGAQGFVNCTEPPFNQTCEIAIASSIDRIRQLHAQWKDILAHSAVLQSVGSLLATICSKLIQDVLDMADITETQSQQLTSYCTRIAGLEDIFLPETSNITDPSKTADHVPQTAIYAHNWLRFQYLVNILESSLVDIKYLWTEGELRLDFKTEEIVDLIEALFGDSPHRRAAIRDIKSGQ